MDFRHIYFDAILSLDGIDHASLPTAIPGHEWAERARKEVLGELHAPTVQSLMVSCQSSSSSAGLSNHAIL
jgi:hypothetical protein